MKNMQQNSDALLRFSNVPIMRESTSLPLTEPKEKSWSVKVIDGYSSDDIGSIKTSRCGDCMSKPVLIAVNPSNPRLVLLGCQDCKCLHKVIRYETWHSLGKSSSGGWEIGETWFHRVQHFREF